MHIGGGIAASEGQRIGLRLLLSLDSETNAACTEQSFAVICQLPQYGGSSEGGAGWNYSGGSPPQSQRTALQLQQELAVSALDIRALSGKLRRPLVRYLGKPVLNT